MKPAAIVNPRAGGGAAGRRWPAVARRWEPRFGAISACFTQAPGDAAALAHKLALAGFDPLIVAGGDGTLNEVVNGVLASGADPALGIAPLGSGCDFARSAAGPQERRLDVVRVEFRGPAGEARERYFLNVAGFGLGAEAARAARGWCRFLPGALRYLAGTIAPLAARRSFRARLWLDGGAPEEVDAALVALANGRYQGGGILVAPNAALEDGLLDITVVERIGLLEVSRHLPILYSGAIYTYPKVRFRRAASVRAESQPAAPLELDGEPVGTLPLTAEVVPRRLRVIAAP